MSCCDLILTVQEEDPITLEITEATIKPEQSKTVTPTYSEQTILPDAGMTLGSVTVEPIPEPTDRMTITENGSYDVARLGGVYVEVPQGVFPEGTLEITENGTYSVEAYASAQVSVSGSRAPVLIDTIDLSAFAEPVASFTIDFPSYKLDGFSTVWFVFDLVTTSAPDWVYMKASTVSTYINKQDSSHSFTKAAFVKIGSEWRLMLMRGTNYPQEGDIIGIFPFVFSTYYNTTRYTGGKVYVYAE